MARASGREADEITASTYVVWVLSDICECRQTAHRWPYESFESVDVQEANHRASGCRKVLYAQL